MGRAHMESYSVARKNGVTRPGKVTLPLTGLTSRAKDGGSGRSKAAGRVSVVFRNENSKGSQKEIANGNNYTDKV